MMEENDVGGGEGSEGTGSAGPSPAEQEAMSLGWEPQEKWHGKPEDWRDAETFLSRGREINGVLKKQLAQRDRELANLRNEMAGMKGTVAELAEYRANLEKRVYDQAMRDLKGQLREAKVNGDIDRQFEVEEAIEGMKEQAPKKADPTPATPAVEPKEFLDWKNRSPWYTNGENPKMVAYADGIALQAIQTIRTQEKRNPTPNEVLALVDEAVRDMFPQAFTTRKAPLVEGGSGQGGPSGNAAKGFSSLPKEAKEQFEKFYSAGYYIDMKTKKPLPKAEAQAEYFKDY